MKQIKKVVTLILAGVMLFSFSGCGKNDNQPAISSDAVEPAVVEKAETTEPVDPDFNPNHPGNKFEPIDMGGRTFTIAYNYDRVYDSNDTEPDKAAVSETDYMIWENLKRIEKKYNCKIDYINIPYEQLGEQLTTGVMAGTPVADIISLPSHVMLAAALNNQIMPLDEFVPKNADIYNDKIVLFSPGKIVGKDYIMMQKNLPIGGQYIAFNNDLIKQLGLESPLELYNKGEWNWENFLKIAKAGTKDTDGDGRIDQWGITGFGSHILNIFVASNGGYFVDSEKGLSGLADPKTMEAMEFVNKLYNVEKVAKVANGDIWDWGGNVDAYKDGKSVMWFAHEWMFPTGDARLPFDYSIAPGPKGPSATQDVRWFQDLGGPCVPRGVENPEWAYIIWEELNDWYADEPSYVEEGTMNWVQSIFLTQEDVENSVKWSDEGRTIDNHTAIPEFPVGPVLAGIVMEGKTVAQVVEENKQIAQDKIDEIFKK